MTRFLTAPIMYLLLALVASAGIFATVQTVRLSGEKAAHADTKRKNLAVLLDIANKTAEAHDKAVKARDMYNEESSAAQLKHSEDLKHAYDKGVAVATGLNDGSLQLRDWWRVRRCPASAGGDDAAALAADQTDDQRRAASAGRIIGIGHTAEADYALTYAALISTRKLLAVCYEKPQ